MNFPACYVHFPFQGNAESFGNRVSDLFRQAENFATRRFSVVNQHQCMFLMDAGIAAANAFPAAVVDQPAG